MSNINLSPTPWSVDESDGHCVVDNEGEMVADLLNCWRDTDDGKAIAVVPEMIEILEALSGSQGNWADTWLNDLAGKCGSILEKIKS